MSKFFIEHPIFANVIAIITMILGAVCIFNLPIAQYPGDHAADDPGHHQLSGRQRRNGRQDHRHPDRAGGQRRRERDVHVVDQRQRRQLHADHQFQGRQRSQHLAVAGAELRQCRSRAIAGRRQRAGRHRPQGQHQHSAGRQSLSPRTTRSTRPFWPITPSSTCSIRWRGLPGVGQVKVVGAGKYSMRVWLDPNKLQYYGLTTLDVQKAIQQQNVEVVAGQLGGPPVPKDQAFQFTVNALGRLSDVEEFENIIVKSSATAKPRRSSASRTWRASSSASRRSPTSRRCSASRPRTSSFYTLPGANDLAVAKEVLSAGRAR